MPTGHPAIRGTTTQADTPRAASSSIRTPFRRLNVLSRWQTLLLVTCPRHDWRPEVGTWAGPLEIAGYAFLITLGCAGAAVATLERAGILQFHYTDRDRRGLNYRMARLVAEIEHRLGSSYSPRYYANYGLDGRKQETQNVTTKAQQAGCTEPRDGVAVSNPTPRARDR